MALYKRGTFIGKTDRMGNEILAGDKIKKLGYGTLYIVNKYGGLSDEGNIPLITAKQWRGEDYEVMVTVDSPDKVEEVTEAQEQAAVDAVNEVRAEESEVEKLRKQLSEAEASVNDYKAAVDFLNGHVEQLEASLKEATRAKASAESRPLGSYSVQELLDEIETREGWMEYITIAAMKEELRNRGFRGQLNRTYTVTMNEAMNIE